MFRLVITEPAQADIQAAFYWWRDHRYAEQAERWYRAIYAAISALRDAPQRYPRAPESDLLAGGLRQRSFGIGRRPTHRIVYAIRGSDVVILRVRHAAQDDLTEGDIG